MDLLDLLDVKLALLIPRQSAGRLGSQMHAPGSFYANNQRGNFSSVGTSGRHPAFMSRNIQQNQRPDTMFRGRPTGRSFVAQNFNRYHQGPTSNQKGKILNWWLCCNLVSNCKDFVKTKLGLVMCFIFYV